MQLKGCSDQPLPAAAAMQGECSASLWPAAAMQVDPARAAAAMQGDCTASVVMPECLAPEQVFAAMQGDPARAAAARGGGCSASAWSAAAMQEDPAWSAAARGGGCSASAWSAAAMQEDPAWSAAARRGGCSASAWPAAAMQGACTASVVMPECLAPEQVFAAMQGDRAWPEAAMQVDVGPEQVFAAMQGDVGQAEGVADTLSWPVDDMPVEEYTGWSAVAMGGGCSDQPLPAAAAMQGECSASLWPAAAMQVDVVPARAAAAMGGGCSASARAAAATQGAKPSNLERDLLLIEAIQDIEKKAGEYLQEDKRLTKNQYAALQMMLEESKMIVGLKPGQGKTIVMIIAALILRDLYKEKKVYLVVQNTHDAVPRFKGDAVKWLQPEYVTQIDDLMETHSTIKQLKDVGNFKENSICIIDEPHLDQCSIPEVKNLKLVTASWSNEKCCKAVVDEDFRPKDIKKDQTIVDAIYSQIVRNNQQVVISEAGEEETHTTTTCELLDLSEKESERFFKLKSDIDDICEKLKEHHCIKKMQIAQTHNLFEYLYNMLTLKKTLERMQSSSVQTLIVLKRFSAEKQKEAFIREIKKLSALEKDEDLKLRIEGLTREIRDFFSQNTPGELIKKYNEGGAIRLLELVEAKNKSKLLPMWQDKRKSLAACSSVITGVHGINYAHTKPDDIWVGPRPEIKLIGNFTEEEEEQAIGRLDRKDNVAGVEVKVVKMRLKIQDSGDRLYVAKETPKLAGLLVENESFKQDLKEIVGEEVLSDYEDRYFSNRDFKGFYARVKFHEKSAEIYDLIRGYLNQESERGEDESTKQVTYSFYAGAEIKIKEVQGYVEMESPYIWSRLEHENSYGKVIEKLCEFHKSQIRKDPICEKLNNKSTGLVLTKEAYKYVQLYADVMEALLSTPFADIKVTKKRNNARVERVENPEKSEEQRVKMLVRKPHIRGSGGGATGSDEVAGHQSKRARHSPEEAVETPEEEQETLESREIRAVQRANLKNTLEREGSSLTAKTINAVTTYAQDREDCRPILARSMPEFQMALKGDEVWIEGTLSSVLIAMKVDIPTFIVIMEAQFNQRKLDPLQYVTTRDPGAEYPSKSYLKGYSLMQLAVYLNDEKGLEYLRYLLKAVTGEKNYVLEHKTTADDESTVLHMAVKNLIKKREERLFVEENKSEEILEELLRNNHIKSVKGIPDQRGRRPYEMAKESGVFRFEELKRLEPQGKLILKKPNDHDGNISGHTLHSDKQEQRVSKPPRTGVSRRPHTEIARGEGREKRNDEEASGQLYSSVLKKQLQTKIGPVSPTYQYMNQLKAAGDSGIDMPWQVLKTVMLRWKRIEHKDRLKEVEVTISDIKDVNIEDLVTLLMNGKNVDREFIKKLIKKNSDAIKEKLEELHKKVNGSKEAAQTFKNIMKYFEIVLEGSADLNPYTERYQALKEKESFSPRLESGNKDSEENSNKVVFEADTNYDGSGISDVNEAENELLAGCLLSEEMISLLPEMANPRSGIKNEEGFLSDEMISLRPEMPASTRDDPRLGLITKKHLWIDKLKTGNVTLNDVPEVLKNDQDVVLEAVMFYGGYEFRFASTLLKANKEVVLKAIGSPHYSGHALNYASTLLKANKEVVLKAVSQSGIVLKAASVDLKANREVVLAAVANNGESLKYASDDLKADREVVLKAVTKKWQSLKYASDDLKADREVVLAAVAKCQNALVYASKALKANRMFLLDLMGVQPWSLQVLNQFKADKEVVLAAVRQNGLVLQFASSELQNDPDVVRVAMGQNKDALQFASVEIQSNPIKVL